MKFSGSKKNIIIVVFCIILLLFSILAFSFKNVITNGFKHNRWFTLDKYEELLKDCDWEREGREIKISCNALLYVASDVDKQVEDRCYNFLTISKNDETTKPDIFNICENWSNVKWDSIDLWLEEKERMTPVKYNLVYKSKNFINFTYDRLEVQNATPGELFDEFYLNTTLKEIPLPIVSKYPNKEIFNNYVNIEKNTFGIEEIGHIYFFDAKLIEKIVENSTMYFTFETRINEQNIKIKTHTKGFMLMKQEGSTFTQEYLTDAMIDKIPVGSKYQLRFFYLTSKTDDFKQKVENFCNSEDIHITKISLCNNKEEIFNEGFKVTNKDEILKNLQNENSENIVNIQNGILYILNI